MRVMVLGGAGAVALEVTKDLVYNSCFDEIIIADLNLKKAKKIAHELLENCKMGFIPEAYKCKANSPDFRKRKISALKVDANNVNDLVNAFQKVDVVACCLPYIYDLQVTEAAVKAGVHTLDLGFASEQIEFDALAREKGISYIPGVGATPGITNLMARQGIENLKKAEEVNICFAAFRCLAPSPGLLMTTFWEFDPETRERVYYHDKKMIPVPPFTGKKKVKFHELIGEQDVFYVPHPETETISKNFPSLRHVSVRGTFTPQVMRLMKALLEAGILNHDEINMYGKKITPYQAIQDLLAQIPQSKKNSTWAYGLVVEVKGKKDGKNVIYRYSNNHPSPDVWGGEAAYYKNIGIPLAIGAEMLALGKIKQKGVVAPEVAIDPEPFFYQLSLRKIKIFKQIIEWEQTL